MSEPTTTPWSAEQNTFGFWRICGPDGTTLWAEGVAKATEAQAHIVAAAPDLLEALKGVLRVADRKTDEFDAARAAIAKAEGRDA